MKVAYLFPCRFLILLGIILLHATGYVSALETTAVDTEGNELHISVTPAQGDLLLIMLVDHDEERVQFEQMLKSVNELDIEVWRADLLADYFLTRSRETVRTMDGKGVAAIIEAAHVQRNKRILLAAYDRMPLPLLRGVKLWQERTTGESRLTGAVLFYPNLFGPPPLAGEDPTLDPIVGATNIALTIFQPEQGAHRWRLSQVIEGFEKAGAPVFFYLVPGVRDWFFMHPPGKYPGEAEATAAVPHLIERFASLMELEPKPLTAVQRPTNPPDPEQVNELVALQVPIAVPGFNLQQSAGGEIDFSDYRGRVVLVNFWATWCPPCVDELPSMNRLARRYAGEDFSIVSVDYRETRDAVQAFTRKVPVNFPVLLDEDGLIALQWKVFSFPSSFLIDGGGNIRFSANRAIDWDTEQVWRAIDSLLHTDEDG